MKKQTSLFSFYNTESIIHKQPALFKLVYTFIISIRVFSSSPYGIHYSIQNKELWIYTSFYLILSFLCFYLSKIPITHLKKLFYILILGFFLILFSNFWTGFLYILRLTVTSLTALILFETTSFLQLQYSLESIPFFKKTGFSTLLTISISFFSEIFLAWDKVNLAFKARTPSKIPLHIQILNMAKQISTFLSYLLIKAETKRLALNNRNV